MAVWGCRHERHVDLRRLEKVQLRNAYDKLGLGNCVFGHIALSDADRYE
jgi:hypothetical protein